MRPQEDAGGHSLCGSGDPGEQLGAKKIHDVQEYHIDTVVMGGDWKGSDKFDYLKDYCELVFLDRTPGISTSQIKEDLGLQEAVGGVDQLPDEPDGAPVGTKKITDLIIYPADFRRGFVAFISGRKQEKLWLEFEKIKSDQEAAVSFGQQDPQAQVLLRLFFKILPSASQVGAHRVLPRPNGVRLRAGAGARDRTALPGAVPGVLCHRG